MSADSQITARLKAAMGFDDDSAADILSVLKTMDKADLPGYLQAFLSDPPAAAEVAALLGATPNSNGASAAAAEAKQAEAKPQKDSRWRKKGDVDDGEDDRYASLQKGKKKGSYTNLAAADASGIASSGGGGGGGGGGGSGGGGSGGGGGGGSGGDGSGGREVGGGGGEA